MNEHLTQPETTNICPEAAALAEKLGLKDQYQEQIKLLNETGILQILPKSQELGLVNINGEESPLPTFEQILSQITPEKATLLAKKANQGFSQLQLIPFGMPLDILIDRYLGSLLQHFKEGQLFFTKKNQDDPAEPLIPIKPEEFDQENPVYLWEEYKQADQNGKLIYFPRQFTKENHGGQTKPEIIKQQGNWYVDLIEPSPNLPRENQGQTKAGRPQLETNQELHQYLQTLQANPIYQGEQGQTPEARLTYALTYLQKHRQVIDDYQGNGSISYQLAAYFPSAGIVPDLYWDRDNRPAALDGNYPDSRSGSSGARSAMRVYP